jgi:hypothetical protein
MPNAVRGDKWLGKNEPWSIHERSRLTSHWSGGPYRDGSADDAGQSAGSPARFSRQRGLGRVRGDLRAFGLPYLLPTPRAKNRSVRKILAQSRYFLHLPSPQETSDLCPETGTKSGDPIGRTTAWTASASMRSQESCFGARLRTVARSGDCSILAEFRSRPLRNCFFGEPAEVSGAANG